MKINRLEAHDRLLHLKKDQEINIFQGAEDCLKSNELSLALQEKSPYIYIFAHARTADDGLTKRLLWQPRLTKPKAQSNSYLFRAQSRTDVITVCWLLPPHETWEQYKKGNVVEHELICWSINMYKTNRKKLEDPEPDDLPDILVRKIYEGISRDSKPKKFQMI